MKLYGHTISILQIWRLIGLKHSEPYGASNVLDTIDISGHNKKKDSFFCNNIK